MTLAEAGEIFKYWEHHPPPHLLLRTIARLLGWAPPVETSQLSTGIVDSPPPGLAVRRDGGLGMPPPLLDPEAMRARNRARAGGGC